MFGFGYDQAGRETRRDLPGGLVLTQDWDAAGQLALQVLTPAPEDSGAATPWPADRRWSAVPTPTGPTDAWPASMTCWSARAGSPG